MAFAQPVHSNPPEKRGKITKILFEIYMKYIKKKKVNAAYIRLMRYFMNIYRYINLLEKLFKVILFLIIPSDSIKYLVCYFFFNSVPTHMDDFLRLL